MNKAAGERLITKLALAEQIQTAVEAFISDTGSDDLRCAVEGFSRVLAEMILVEFDVALKE